MIKSDTDCQWFERDRDSSIPIRIAEYGKRSEAAGHMSICMTRGSDGPVKYVGFYVPLKSPPLAVPRLFAASASCVVHAKG